MTRLDLVFAIASAFLLLMIVLQSVLDRSVWAGYLIALPLVLIAWVFLAPWPLAVTQ